MDRRGFMGVLLASLAGCASDGAGSGDDPPSSPNRTATPRALSVATPPERSRRVEAALADVRTASAALTDEVRPLPERYGAASVSFDPGPPRSALSAARETLRGADPDADALVGELLDSVAALDAVVGMFDAYADATTRFHAASSHLDSDDPQAAVDAFDGALDALKTARERHDRSQSRYRDVDRDVVPERSVPVEPLSRDLATYGSELSFAEPFTRGYRTLAAGFVDADAGARELRDDSYEAAADAFGAAVDHFTSAGRTFRQAAIGTAGKRRRRYQEPLCLARTRRRATKALQRHAEARLDGDAVAASRALDDARDAVHPCSSD